MNVAFVGLTICVVILLVFFIYLFYRAIKTKDKAIILVAIICFGLLFDSAIIFVGNFLGEQSQILKMLWTKRFVLHGALVYA